MQAIAPMTPAQALAYVRASAVALGIPMDDERLARVAGYLALSARFAALLDAADLGPEVEPAEVFCPAPFPPVSGHAARKAAP